MKKKTQKKCKKKYKKKYYSKKSGAHLMDEIILPITMSQKKIRELSELSGINLCKTTWRGYYPLGSAHDGLCNCDKNYKFYNYYLGDQITGEHNNYVYFLCHNKPNSNKCNYVLKIRTDPGGFENSNCGPATRSKTEVKLAQKAFDIGISPETVDMIECNDIYKKKCFLIITKYYGKGTLSDLIKKGYYVKHEKIINEKLKNLLDTAYIHNLMHNDLNDGNILYDFPSDNKPENIEFKLIDWEWGESFCKCQNTPVDNNKICEKCLDYNGHKQLYTIDYSIEHFRKGHRLRDGIKLYSMEEQGA